MKLKLYLLLLTPFVWLPTVAALDFTLIDSKKVPTITENTNFILGADLTYTVDTPFETIGWNSRFDSAWGGEWTKGDILQLSFNGNNKKYSLIFKTDKPFGNVGGGGYETPPGSTLTLSDLNLLSFEGSADYGFRFTATKGTINISDITILSFKNNAKGAIYCPSASILLSNIGEMMVEGIQTSAFTNFKILSMTHSGDMRFVNNKAGGSGAVGAVIQMLGDEKVTLSADYGNILFQGNTPEVYMQGKAGQMIGTSIRFGNNAELNLRAQEGREIVFYDAISGHGQAEKGTIHFNAAPDGLEAYNGTPLWSGVIRFSGEKVEDYLLRFEAESDGEYAARVQASKDSTYVGDTILHGGKLILEYGVSLGSFGSSDIKKNTSFKALGGEIYLLTLSGIKAQQMSFSKTITLISENGSWLKAKNIDMSQGFNFDFTQFLSQYNSGINITADIIAFGGTISIVDSNIDYYTHNQWSQRNSFLILDVLNVKTITGSFEELISQAQGSSVVDSVYAYQGTWNYEWKDTNADGKGDQLFAVWTPDSDSGIGDVDPELEGNIVSNSMWSSASNAKALSNTALENANILRFESSMQSNFWVKGIGDFAYDDSTAELDGYSYQGGGYAAGADFKLGKKSIVGVAFGQLMGDNKSELYTSKIKQDSMMGSLYAAHLQTLNKRNSLLWTLAGTYGDTENSMNTHYSDGQNSSGSWNNNAYFVEAKMEWRIAPEGKSWTYKPFIGVEYTEVNLEGFTEVGDKAREFAEGAYKNIALPIGIGFEHQRHFGKKTWLNSLSLAYVPDAYREAPNTQATRLSNGFSWKDQASKPSIHTLRATINSTLQLNASWTAYAGYTFEAREDASYHNVNAGLSYSF